MSSHLAQPGSKPHKPAITAEHLPFSYRSRCILSCIFYSRAFQGSVDELNNIGASFGSGLKDIIGFDQLKVIWLGLAEAKTIGEKGTALGKGLALSLAWLVGSLLKVSCFLILEIGLTLGMFLLHILGDSAIAAKESGSMGMGCGWVLATNFISHFLADFGFVHEFSHQGCDANQQETPDPKARRNTM